jgi:Lrp/AsnC family transcriptional regulator, leucine-responsive regulatory protein
MPPSCRPTERHLLVPQKYETINRQMAVALDDIDVRLLTALQGDADRSNVELARMVGLSPAATLHRVRRLKESGVIRLIAARLDPAAAGFPLHVYVAASLARHDPRSTRTFEDQVRAIPQIIAADNVAGEMDYLLTIVARDVAELQQGPGPPIHPRRPTPGDLPPPGGDQAALPPPAVPQPAGRAPTPSRSRAGRRTGLCRRSQRRCDLRH